MKLAKRRKRHQPHWICTTPSVCCCTGSDYDCQCIAGVLDFHPSGGVVTPPVKIDACVRCGAAMVCIDFETGALLGKDEIT